MLNNTNTTLPVVQPQVIDGIELYATDEFTGMSQSGLARFCGIPESTLRLLLENTDRGKSGVQSLESFAGQEFAIAVNNGRAGKPSKVISASLCAAICLHYAYKGNETAQFSAQKFISMGIDSWIRQVTGHSQKPALDPAQIALQLSMELIAVQKDLLATQARLVEVQEDRAVKSAFISSGEGLQMMFECFDEDEDQLSPEQQDDGLPYKYSIREYLSLVQEVDLSTVSRGVLQGYGRKVADTFKTHKLEEPEERMGPRGGKHKVYGKEHFPLLGTAWESYRRERALENIKRLK